MGEEWQIAAAEEEKTQGKMILIPGKPEGGPGGGRRKREK